MLKNITFSADEELIRQARRRAREKGVTLNVEFRRWLEKYVQEARTEADFQALMERLAYVQAGRKFSRDEMNER